MMMMLENEVYISIYMTVGPRKCRKIAHKLGQASIL